MDFVVMSKVWDHDGNNSCDKEVRWSHHKRHNRLRRHHGTQVTLRPEKSARLSSTSTQSKLSPSSSHC